MKLCNQCKNGEIKEAAIVKVRYPNPDRPNLKIIECVCNDHLIMLQDDYGNDLTILERLK